MKGGIIEISDAAWKTLSNHLLPSGNHLEQGAFLLVQHAVDQAGRTTFRAAETILLTREDFVTQAGDYLEIKDETKAQLIKRAHDKQLALIEFHSHPGPYSACLSLADIIGLRDFAPHILWRLRGRPYAAIVVARNSLDGLMWGRSASDIQPIFALKIDDRLISATGLSWDNLNRGIYGQV